MAVLGKELADRNAPLLSRHALGCRSPPTGRSFLFLATHYTGLLFGLALILIPAAPPANNPVIGLAAKPPYTNCSFAN
jgi:hypothetical protein